MVDQIKVLIGEKNGNELDREEYILNADTLYLDPQNTGLPNVTGEAIRYLAKRKFYWDIHKTRSGNYTMSNGTWFDSWPAQYACGSYSGYASSCYPIQAPFKCKLVEVMISFRRADFDYSGTAVNIKFELGLYKMTYNGHTDYARITIPLGSFSGSSTFDSNHKYIIQENSFIYRVGDSNINQHDIFGFMFRKDVSVAGQISSFRDPIIKLKFEEVYA